MSVQGAVIANLDGLVFNKGYLYGTRSGGATDAIAFGALQNVSLAHEFARVELSGPESLSPLGVGIGSESLTGRYSSGVLAPEQLIMLLGGSQVVDGANTDYIKKVEEQPLVFDLHFESGPSPLDDIDITLYRCLCDTWNVSFDNRAFSLQEGSFKVYGEANSGRLFKVTRPGDWTNSS